MSYLVIVRNWTLNSSWVILKILSYRPRVNTGDLCIHEWPEYALKTLKFTILTFRYGAIGASLNVTNTGKQALLVPRPRSSATIISIRKLTFRRTECGVRPLSNTLSKNFSSWQRSCCSTASKLTEGKIKYCHTTDRNFGLIPQRGVQWQQFCGTIWLLTQLYIFADWWLWLMKLPSRVIPNIPPSSMNDPVNCQYWVIWLRPDCFSAHAAGIFARVCVAWAATRSHGLLMDNLGVEITQPLVFAEVLTIRRTIFMRGRSEFGILD